MSRVLVALAVLAAGCAGPPGPVDVVAGRYDDGRTGANLREHILTPAGVRNGFGRLFSYSVDGFVYAQPLVVTGLATAAGPRDALIVATTRNKLYALDADSDAVGGGLIWQQDLTPPGHTLDEPSGADLRHLAPSVGILSTPVIDRATGTIYVVSRSRDPGGSGQNVQRLHALALETGAAKKPAVTIAATVNGRSFNPAVQLNRPGLALVRGLVIVAWGSFLDSPYATGWVMAYDADTLEQKGVFCTTCASGSLGMIWQSGRPPAVDGRYIYLFTANGSWSGSFTTFEASCEPTKRPAKPAGYFAESLIKLDAQQPQLWSRNQGVATWTPYDWCELEYHDTDLGSSGPMLIPGVSRPSPRWGSPGSFSGPTTIAIGGGKAGVMYAIDAAKITGPDLVEWNPLPAPNQYRYVSAINECVDFDTWEKTVTPANGTGVDVPANWPWPPTGVTLGPHVGGEHGPIDTVLTRPLCAPVNIPAVEPDSSVVPGATATIRRLIKRRVTDANYGVKSDGKQHHVMAGPVFWPTTWLVDIGLPAGQPGTGLLYVEPENLPLLAYEVREGHITGIRAHGHEQKGPRCPRPSISAHPGGQLTLSANGDMPDSGIVWVTHYREEYHGANATFAMREGVLEAFDAATLELLWSSDTLHADRVGPFAKFTPPTVANGKVYVAVSPSPTDPEKSYHTAAANGAIVVYGLKRDVISQCLPEVRPPQRPFDLFYDPGPLALLLTVAIATSVITTLVVGRIANRRH